MYAEPHHEEDSKGRTPATCGQNPAECEYEQIIEPREGNEHRMSDKPVSLVQCGCDSELDTPSSSTGRVDRLRPFQVSASRVDVEMVRRLSGERREISRSGEDIKRFSVLVSTIHFRAPD